MGALKDAINAKATPHQRAAMAASDWRKANGWTRVCDIPSDQYAETGYGIGFCATAPQYALDFRQAGRELARVDDVGNVTIADDITLDEAKFVITELAKAVLSGLQDRRNRS